MEFVIVLLCLGFQKLWPEGARYHQNNWFGFYFDWIKARAEKISAWRGVLSIVVILLPLLLVLLLLSTALRGVVGHFLLGIIVLWYCLGFDNLKDGAHANVKQLFLVAYHQVFAVIFWYALLGPWGAGVYYILTQLRMTLEKDKAGYKDVLPTLVRIQGVMDWVPVRVLGITFALVGHFSTLFPLWLKELPGKIDHTEQDVLEWGLKSLELSKPSESETTRAGAAQALVDRSVIVWLVALALISIGSLVG